MTGRYPGIACWAHNRHVGHIHGPTAAAHVKIFIEAISLWVRKKPVPGRVGPMVHDDSHPLLRRRPHHSASHLLVDALAENWACENHRLKQREIVSLGQHVAIAYHLDFSRCKICKNSLTLFVAGFAIKVRGRNPLFVELISDGL